MERKNYLKSKTTVPNTLHQILPRESIAAIINSTVLDKAVCFVAPYGYGKTLAVVSWLCDCEKKAAWITLDAADNSEQFFWASLSAAVLRVTGWQGDMNDILSCSKYIENPQDFFWETILSAEKSGCDRILVIDNFRFICEIGLLRSIRAIISALLGRWRLIIMSRTELPPIFTELIMKGNICLITARELSFSSEEMVEYFTLSGCEAPQQAVLSIRNETEGWPASLNVVSMLSRGGDIVYDEAARGYVMNFFETEIWNSLEEKIKDFLLKTSVLDKLTPAGCRTVTGIAEVLPALQKLFINGLFIAKLDEKDTYRYHCVFRDFLLDRLKKSDIDEQELYRKLGWWHFDNDEIMLSFPYFYKAYDLYGISQVLEMIQLSDMGSLEEYVERMQSITNLSIMLLKPYPVIMARIALIHFLTGNLEQMLEIYHLLSEWVELEMLSLTSDEYVVLSWEIGWLCMLDPNESSLENEKHRNWVGLHKNHTFLKELQMSRSAILYFPTMLKGARDYGDDGLFQTEDIMARIEVGEKNLVDEEEAQWLSYLLLAEYHYERERFAEAERIVRRIMPLVEKNRLTFMYFIATVLLVKIIRAVHNANEIGELIKWLEVMIENNGHRFLLPNFHAFEVRNRLAEGQSGFTEIFEMENRDYEDKPYFFLIYRHFTLVRGHISLGNYSKAMLILGNLELLCQRYNRPTDLIEVNTLKAISLYNLGFENDACQHLLSAIKLAERYSFIRMFSDDAKDLWPVLELVRKQTSGKYIQQIIISCKKMIIRLGCKPFASKSSHIKITKAELKILKAVQSGMSYTEIAQDNGIRMSTVKSHLHSIYSKLEVNNKTAAVITAENMGILESVGSDE